VEEIRDDFEFIDGHSIPIVSDGVGEATMWLFAGGLVSASIAWALTQAGISVAGWNDVSVTARTDDVTTMGRVLANLDPAAAHPALPDDILTALKFGLCLPHKVAEAVIVARTSRPAELADAILRRPRRILVPNQGL
jgi:hypothetical protein